MNHYLIATLGGEDGGLLELGQGVLRVDGDGLVQVVQGLVQLLGGLEGLAGSGRKARGEVRTMPM